MEDHDESGVLDVDWDRHDNPPVATLGHLGRLEGPGSKTAPLVFLTIASFCDADHACFPRRQEIADRCNLHLSQVALSLACLRDAGLLTVTHRTHNGRQVASRYHLHAQPARETVR